MTNETALDWLERNHKSYVNFKIDTLFKENKNVQSTNRFLKIKVRNVPTAKGPADIKPDNRSGSSGPKGDDLEGNTFPRKNPNGTTYAAGQGAGVYAESENIKVKVYPEPKETKFSKDKDKEKRLKFGDKSLSANRIATPPGLGSEFNTRTNGTGLTGGAGLGNQTYSESQEYSNSSPASTAMPRGVSPNPLNE